MKRFLFEHQLLVRTPIFIEAEDEHEARIKIDHHINEPIDSSYEDLGCVVLREEELEP